MSFSGSVAAPAVRAALGVPLAPVAPPAPVVPLALAAPLAPVAPLALAAEIALGPGKESALLGMFPPQTAERRVSTLQGDPAAVVVFLLRQYLPVESGGKRSLPVALP
jgi:hypothetical protein